MRVVVAAVAFGRLDSIGNRSRIEDALRGAGINYEVTQTALLLDPVAQARSFARFKLPHLYFLVDQASAEAARDAVRAVDPHAVEV